MALSSPISTDGIVVETKFNWNDAAFKNMKGDVMLGLFRLGGDIAQRARHRAPVKTTALRSSIRVEAEGNSVYIRAGGTVVAIDGENKKVDYALIREKENHLHPWTTHYMEYAERDAMADNWQKFFQEELA